MGKDMRAFIHGKGDLQSLTVLETPYRNEVAERLDRALMSSFVASETYGPMFSL